MTRRFVFGLVVFVSLVSTTTVAATLHDPALRFRTLSTDHFVIYYHQGEDRLAARLAMIAEETWARLQPPLGLTPPARTHVVLADESELANGSATPLPYNTILVTAAWPAGSEFIGNTDDWLRLVFTHEFTHVVHLDRSRGWARLFRDVFGRTPIAFPNLFLPIWQIEGIATYEESAITGEGRLHAGDFQAVVGEAARTRRLEPLDRVNGGLTDWPGGLTPYAYGLGFHAYLAERFGANTLGSLANATAGRVPFTASRVFKTVVGESLGQLWREYESAQTTGPAQPRFDSARRLTNDGFVASGPRFLPACAECPAQIVYARRTPHEFPALAVLTLDGSAPDRLTTRYLGVTAGVGRDTIVFDQQELRRNTGLYSDLYVLDRPTGRVRQLTFEARLLDPDLSSDQASIVAVQAAPGRRDLVVLDTTGTEVGATTILLSSPDTQFNAPRWSPDGRTIAVERHRQGSRSEIVLLDVATRSVRTITFPAARVVTPTWRPDGQAIVAAADPDDGPFNLYEFGIDQPTPVRQLTHLTGGATWPEVSSDGSSIVFVGYTADGFDLFEMAYPAKEPMASPPGAATGAAQAATGTDERLPRVGVELTQPAADAPPSLRSDREYSPWPTLRPTSWSPIIAGDRQQIRIGAATGGSDVLGYHAYALSATWLASASSGAVTPGSLTPDWSLAYTYDRWRPTFWVVGSSDTSFFAGPADDSGRPSAAVLRERQLEAGVLFPIRHVRSSNTFFASLLRGDDGFTFAGGELSRSKAAARAAWVFTSAKTFGYSISSEDGGTIGVTAELARSALGSSADATALTADGRLYLPAFAPHHVLAVRLAAGTSWGDPTLGRTFHLGGGGPNVAALSFGRNALSLLRGFPADTFGGRRIALANADYRWPIARPQRGVGTWPFFLRTIHAAVFVDVGHTWNRSFRIEDMKSAVGAELSADTVLGYSFPVAATIGAAWGRDGSRSVAGGGILYFRIGRAF